MIIPHMPSTPFQTEIYEAYIHWGVLSGAAEEAEKVFQHPAAYCLQIAVCLEGQAGQAGRWKHRVGWKWTDSALAANPISDRCPDYAQFSAIPHDHSVSYILWLVSLTYFNCV